LIIVPALYDPDIMRAYNKVKKKQLASNQAPVGAINTLSARHGGFEKLEYLRPA